MTEKLTDEQLRGMAVFGIGNAEQRKMAANELLAFRAEQAKPTQGDEERARRILNYLGSDDDEQGGALILQHLASIRAEGSAERAKLEAALREALEWRSKDMPTGVALRLSKLLAQPAESGATEHLESEECGQLSDEDELASTIAFHRHIGSTPHAEARAILAGAKP